MILIVYHSLSNLNSRDSKVDRSNRFDFVIIFEFFVVSSIDGVLLSDDDDNEEEDVVDTRRTFWLGCASLSNISVSVTVLLLFLIGEDFALLEFNTLSFASSFWFRKGTDITYPPFHRRYRFCCCCCCCRRYRVPCC